MTDVVAVDGPGTFFCDGADIVVGMLLMVPVSRLVIVGAEARV